MLRRRLLTAWIGHNDLRAMAATLPKRQLDALREVIGPFDLKASEAGPIRSLVEAERFDEIVLLSNYADVWNRNFADWLGQPATVRRVSLENPTDYAEIFRVVDSELQKLKALPSWPETELCIHLSPGSPAMAAVWVLLGKSRYPATFYQTFKGKAWVTDIPFDLAIDFVPELLRAPDIHFQHLARQAPHEVQGFERIIGDSPVIRTAVGRAKRAAMRGVSILILGESGTGKEVFARAIHDASPRREKPFIAINCAAVPKDLLESELFGHKRGAFTGADKDRVGAFEAADGGTLFLDEVGECDLVMQSKLLRVLQSAPGDPPCRRRFTRVGETVENSSDVRVIAATNQNLLKAIGDGHFREDLFYRLAVITLKLPPLRERSSDAAKIATGLLSQINHQFRTEDVAYRDKSLSASAKAFVSQHQWPGNVRQLQNALVQAAVLADGDVIGRRDLEESIAEFQGTPSATPLDADLPLGDGFCLQSYLEELQRKYLRRAMKEAGGVKTAAAKLLGYGNYQTLAAQLKRLGVDP